MLNYTHFPYYKIHQSFLYIFFLIHYIFSLILPIPYFSQRNIEFQYFQYFRSFSFLLFFFGYNFSNVFGLLKHFFLIHPKIFYFLHFFRNLLSSSPLWYIRIVAYIYTFFDFLRNFFFLIHSFHFLLFRFRQEGLTLIYLDN